MREDGHYKIENTSANVSDLAMKAWQVISEPKTDFYEAVLLGSEGDCSAESSVFEPESDHLEPDLTLWENVSEVQATF